MRDITFHAQATHIMNLPKLHRSVNRTPVIDIEFNREGTRPKYALIEHVNKLARPDIILHNRKTGPNKNNILVVECKKRGTTKRQLQDIKNDVGKIRGFMTDPRFAYTYGLQVVYSPKSIAATLFYFFQGAIAEEPIKIC